MGWLKRLLRDERAAEGHRNGRDRAFTGAGPATIDASLERPDSPKALEVPDAFGARQPLLSATGTVAGFEFEMPSRSRVAVRLGEAPDTTATALAFGARAIGLVN